MSRPPEVDRVLALAQDIEQARAIGVAGADIEARLIDCLKLNRDTLEPHLRGEQRIFSSYPSRRDDLARLADAGLHYVLDSIERFFCDGWRDAQLPPEFFLMRNLNYANVSGTCFESIAGDYAGLTKLETLVAEEVWTLRFLDDPSVADAPAIREVYLNACGLEVFPERLFDAATLESLTISYCHDGELLTRPFWRIPSGLSRLRSLKRLDLCAIGLEEVPEEMFSMTWLERLDLSSNRIDVATSAGLRSALPDTELRLDP